MPCKGESQTVQLFQKTCLDFSFRETSEGNEKEFHLEAPIDTSRSTRTVKPRWTIA